MEEKRESNQQRAAEQPTVGSREATDATSLTTFETSLTTDESSLTIGESIWSAQSSVLCRCLDPEELASVLTVNHTKNAIEDDRKG